MFHINVKKGSVSKKWYWRIESSNGKVAAHSETYASKRMCLKTVDSLSRQTSMGIKIECEGGEG
ncbi:MAG TPA: DUF1508 domain-containing protein [Nitrospirae bacterium]|nr:DUF1508 domain-containing protein [Nitrospirota bacterium]